MALIKINITESILRKLVLSVIKVVLLIKSIPDTVTIIINTIENIE